MIRLYCRSTSTRWMAHLVRVDSKPLPCSYMRVIAMQSSLDTREVVVKGVAGALIERIKATIREVEVNARVPGDQDEVDGLRQMRQDSETVDACAIANAWLSSGRPSTLQQPVRSFSPDEDLLARSIGSVGERP